MPKERLHTPLSRPLLEIKRSDNQELVLDTTHGQMYRMAKQRYNVLDFGRDQRILDCWNCDKTGFTIHPGPFCFTSMNFGLEIVLGMCQQTMHVLLTKVKWKFVLGYLDDIVLFSRTPDEQIDMFDNLWLYYTTLEWKWRWWN